MGLKCLFGHKWNGCKCLKCDTTRNEGHKFAYNSNCFEKCEICGKLTGKMQHKWNGCKCKRCGLELHKWHDYKCRICSALAFGDYLRSIKQEEVESITDQSMLEEIAKNGYEKFAQMEAIKNITNQSLLEEIAMNDKNEMVRCAAVEKLYDQILVSKIARNDKSVFVRYAAVRNLYDEAFIAEIAKNNSSSEVREYTVKEKLTDQTLLAYFAKNEKNDNIRAAAIIKLNDLSFFIDFSKFENCKKKGHKWKLELRTSESTEYGYGTYRTIDIIQCVNCGKIEVKRYDGVQYSAGFDDP